MIREEVTANKGRRAAVSSPTRSVAATERGRPVCVYFDLFGEPTPQFTKLFNDSVLGGDSLAPGVRDIAAGDPSDTPALHTDFLTPASLSYSYS